MKVLCTGMPKTGTKTLASALRTLGYDVYDVEEQFYYLGKDLLEITKSGWTTDDFKRIFNNVDAVTDVMSNCLWEEIFRAFPNVKVIHTERASEKEWSESFLRQLSVGKKFYFTRILLSVTPTGRRLRRYVATSMRLAAFEPEKNIFWVSDLNKQLASIRYREHNSQVKQVVPKNQLLLFNLSDGWEPLCKFLNKPVPSQEFPHKNKAGSFAAEFIDHSIVFDAIKKEFSIFLGILVIALGLLLYYVHCA